MHVWGQMHPGPFQGRAAGMEGTLQVPETADQAGPGQASPWQHVRWTADGETGECWELKVCGECPVELSVESLILLSHWNTVLTTGTFPLVLNLHVSKVKYLWDFPNHIHIYVFKKKKFSPFTFKCPGRILIPSLTHIDGYLFSSTDDSECWICQSPCQLRVKSQHDNKEVHQCLDLYHH